jgi:plastocyanin domain-containing protein
MKSIVMLVFVAGVLFGGAFMLFGGSSTDTTASLAENVSVVDGKQIVAITAKGKYSPPVSVARAGVPTVLRMRTNGTFDCTSALTISAIGYQANLPPSGVTDIEIPPQQPGVTIQGLCAMGMYNFTIKFL